MDSDKRTAIIALKAISMKSAKLADELDHGRLWDADLSDGATEIRQHLADIERMLLPPNVELSGEFGLNERLASFFNEWWDDLKCWPQTKDEIRQVWDAAISAGLKDAAGRFEGTLAFNWVCADGYSNGLDIGGELRYMSQERANAELSGSTASSASPVPTPC